MEHPTARLLTLLELLQTHASMRREELAARLEVGERSVRRYVATLQALGIPVVGERGRSGIGGEWRGCGAALHDR